MQNQAVDALTLGGSTNYDLSIWGLFFQADIVVKVVLVILLFASFWTWAIIFEKGLRMRRLRSQAEDFEESFWSGGSLEDLYDRMDRVPPDPMTSLFVSAICAHVLRRRCGSEMLA